MNLRLGSLILFLVCAASLTAQFGVPLNDNCDQSFRLNDLENFCSVDLEFFSSEGATVDNTEGLGCQTSFQPRAVWYNFTALTKFVRITVEGQDGSNGLLLTEPILGVYEGSCDNLTEIICVTTPDNINIDEVVLSTLPGRNYKLMIGGKNGSVGSFRLCINSFNTDPVPLQDCGNARILCDKSPIGVESVVGVGSMQDNLSLSTNPSIQFPQCGVREDASNWYKWTCEQAGTLEFTITPLKQFDDIDFIVYEFPNGIQDCNSKVLLRHMISGENQGDDMRNWQICVGPTGLRVGDGADGETCGCQDGDNNFANALNMEAGKSYGLLVMNFSQSGRGYNLNWGGTGTFLGPVPEFSIDPIEGLRCEQSFTIEDRSRNNGNPLLYEWYFGEDASPEFSSEAGPFDVTYNTFGAKSIVLSVTDQVNGCEVTEIFNIFADPCCDDKPAVEAILVDRGDPTCPTDIDGFLTIDAEGGSDTGYTFSINGSPFVASSDFQNLPDGDYTIVVVDNTGCEATLTNALIDPDSILLDAGLASVIELGEDINLQGVILQENGRDYDILWTWDSEGTEVSCLNCLDPNVLPHGITNFTLSALDDLGCLFTDRTVVDIDMDYPLYIPTIFSPNQDGNNDRFTAYSDNAVIEIALLKIFDRWGNLVYEEKNFPHNSPNHGWDGLLNGNETELGVYSYLFEIQFIDNLPPRKYYGDITLAK